MLRGYMRPRGHGISKGWKLGSTAAMACTVAPILLNLEKVKTPLIINDVVLEKKVIDCDHTHNAALCTILFILVSFKRNDIVHIYIAFSSSSSACVLLVCYCYWPLRPQIHLSLRWLEVKSMELLLLLAVSKWARWRRYWVQVSNKNTQNNGAVDCIRCDVPVCIAAGFSPETKKNMKKKSTLNILEKYSQNIL